MCQREVMLDWFGCEFRGKSLSGHSHSIEQLLGTRSAALVQPGTQLRKMEKRADGLNQTDASNAGLSIPIRYLKKKKEIIYSRENLLIDKSVKSCAKVSTIRLFFLESNDVVTGRENRNHTFLASR